MAHICTNCGRKHNGNKSSASVDTCDQCYEIAGYENTVQDGGTLSKEDKADVSSLHRAILAKGGTPAHMFTDADWLVVDVLGKPAPTKKEGVKGIERQIPGTFLRPTECADEAEVLEHAMAGDRKRAVMAIKPNGTMVVCCARTARKHGWEIEGSFYSTSTSKPKAEAPASKKAARAAKLAEIDTQNIHAASNKRITKAMEAELADLM